MGRTGRGTVIGEVKGHFDMELPEGANETAYRDFLSTLCLTPDTSEVLDKKLEPYCRPFELAGKGMMIAGVMLLGAAIAAAVMGVSLGATMCKYGLLAVFAGAFFVCIPLIFLS